MTPDRKRTVRSKAATCRQQLGTCFFSQLLVADPAKTQQLIEITSAIRGSTLAPVTG